LTQFDADAFAIARTAKTLAEHYMEEVLPPINFFLLSNNTLALQAVKNLRSTKAHHAVVRFHKVLTLLTLHHRHVSYFLVWAPSDNTLAGDTEARMMAKEASWGLPPDGMDCIQSVAYQKDRARHKAFLAWEHKFGLEHCLTQFCLNVTGSSGEGHAYRECIITEPVAQHMAQHTGYRRLTFGRRCLIVLSAVYRAQVNTSDILLGRVSGFSPLLIYVKVTPMVPPCPFAHM
jgi:hypothetical protein